MNKIKNELITIQSSEDGVQTVSARDLYNGLKIKTKFADWFKRVCEYGFEENKDFTVLKNEKGKNGQFANIEYYISIDMAKQICMLQRSEKGKQYREYFLQIEKAWNSPEAIYARALQMANHTLEHYKDKVVMLESENNQLKHALEYDQIVDWKAWNKLKNEWKSEFEELNHRISFKELIEKASLEKDIDFKNKVMGDDKFPTTMISPSGEDKLWNYFDR